MDKDLRRNADDKECDSKKRRKREREREKKERHKGWKRDTRRLGGWGKKNTSPSLFPAADKGGSL